MKAYEYRHIVTLEETNLMGNVYYLNHLRWQGQCRERFLQEHAPGVLSELGQSLHLVTLHCSCDYFGEIYAFEEVIVRMFLKQMSSNRITMRFEYWRRNHGTNELIARGEQATACLRREGNRFVPEAVPAGLRMALQPYAPLTAPA